jgi:sporulation protein YlmC with PRC-barrel domain
MGCSDNFVPDQFQQVGHGSSGYIVPHLNSVDGVKTMNKLAIAAAVAATLTGAAYGQTPTTQAPTTTDLGGSTPAGMLTAIPQAATSIAGFYQHNVYDSANLDVKIGQIKDVLLDKNGRIEAFIIGVDDFIGVSRKDRDKNLPPQFIDEKNVAVPFNSIRVIEKDGVRWLTMNVTRDDLKSAPGYKYDKSKASWDPA